MRLNWQTVIVAILAAFFPLLSYSQCSGHGTLNATTLACVCNSGYAGPQCQYSNSGTCSGHGVVQSSGSCVCDAHWAGQNCQTPSVVLSFSGGTSCSGHGTLSGGKCVCNNQWTGSSCNTCPPKYGGANCDRCALGLADYPACVAVAPLICGGHGSLMVVAGRPQCVCNQGYTGPQCATCATNFYFNGQSCVYCLASTTCSGNGTCASNGTCACKNGFSGPNCK